MYVTSNLNLSTRPTMFLFFGHSFPSFAQFQIIQIDLSDLDKKLKVSEDREMEIPLSLSGYSWERTRLES